MVCDQQSLGKFAQSLPVWRHSCSIFIDESMFYYRSESSRILLRVVFATTCIVGFGMLQGFQCSTTDVAIAKKAIGAKDYVKARVAIEKAIIEDTSNCEAFGVLGDVERLEKRYQAMNKAYAMLRACSSVKPEQAQRTSLETYNVWVEYYNRGIELYNQFTSNKSEELLVQAAAVLDSAFQAKPEFSETLSLIGMVYEAMGDTAQAVRAYKQWWGIEQFGAEFLANNGVTLAMPRGQMLKVVGTPQQQKMDSLANNQGVLYKDLVTINGVTAYVFSQQVAQDDATVIGWSVQPPSHLTTGELWRVRQFSLSPLKNLAYLHFSAGKKQDALHVIGVVQKVAPKDVELSTLKTQLLADLGQTDQALMEAAALVNKHPENVTYKLQYAALLSNVNKVAEANVQYTHVLNIESSNETALYNLAANFKNIASTKQRDEFDKLEKNSKYQVNTQYLDDLGKAAGYFELLRNIAKYRDDLIVMEQLINIYEVRGQKQKVQSMIGEFESLESKYASTKDYWQILEGVYARAKMNDKSTMARKRAEKL
jgi:Flp pilus assembly protein TadD